MRFHYDKAVDAFYVRFDERPYASSDEVSPGVIFDYDRSGKIIGIEILDASRKLSPKFRSSLRKQRAPLAVGARL